MQTNLAFVDLLKRVAGAKKGNAGADCACLAAGTAAYVVPIPGTTKLSRLEENIGSSAIELTPKELSEIDESASRLNTEGDRYSLQPALLHYTQRALDLANRMWLKCKRAPRRAR
jgi:diketogulonate reductase-like aldo/keto reductase